jgi:hypothetical protein
LDDDSEERVILSDATVPRAPPTRVSSASNASSSPSSGFFAPGGRHSGRPHAVKSVAGAPGLGAGRPSTMAATTSASGAASRARSGWKQRRRMASSAAASVARVAADAVAGSPRGRRSGRDTRQRHFRANAERSVGLSAAVASGTGSRNETHATCVTEAPRSEAAARGGEEGEEAEEEAAASSSSDSETTTRG